MGDEDGPKVARWFYDSLFSREKVDLDGIAYALDEAVAKLRQGRVGRALGSLHPHRWLTPGGKMEL
jgi:hypothetical protein